MFCYAQLDDLNYCIGISELSGEVDLKDMVPIEAMDNSFLNRKYDLKNKKWLDEYKESTKSETLESKMTIEDLSDKINKIESLLEKLLKE